MVEGQSFKESRALPSHFSIPFLDTCPVFDSRARWWDCEEGGVFVVIDQILDSCFTFGG